MAETNVSFPLQNTKITDAIVDYARHAQEYLYSHFMLRDRLEEIDRAYQLEEDRTEQQVEAKNSTRSLGDKTKRTNITVPIIMPQVEAALGYFVEVFLTGYPIFGVGGPPEFDDAAMMLETIVGENSITAGWARQLLMFFRDGLKYNLQGCEVVWDRKTVAAVETDMQFTAGKFGKPKEIVWEGNCLKRMDLYNTIIDPRVPPAEIHTRGEFAGYVEIKSRIELKRMINNLFGKIPPMVATKAFESGSNDVGARSYKDMGFYIPQVNPDAFIDRQAMGTFDWMSWATEEARRKIQYRNVYEVLTLYARIIPSDFGLFVPQDNTPQIWKFIIINNKVLLYAERMTNAHDWIPIVFGQPLEDGLDYQTKSFAQNAIPFQDLASAAMNANIASKRRLVMDRGLYDPSRVREADINSDNPSAKIPVRPSAYGKPVGDAYHEIPYRDELSGSIVQESELYVRYADRANGQNPVQQGQFQKGNKTRHEFQDVMGHSNSRNKTMSIMMEYQALAPMKDMIKINTLQYQQPDDLYNRDRGSVIKIDPIVLRKAVATFKISDGLTPGDKLFNTEEFQVAVQALGSNPQLAQQYRLSQVFTHLFKQRGVDLRPFEKTQLELQYEQALQAWTQAVQVLYARKDLTPEQIKQALPPQPQPPNPQDVQKQIQQMRQQRGIPLSELVQQAVAGGTPNPAATGNPNA